CTNSTQNIGIGFQALLNNGSGNGNTGIGLYALESNTSGFQNNAIGWAALLENTTGYLNTAMGQDVLWHNTTGFFNTAMGYFALKSNQTGSTLTAIGYDADVNADGYTNSTAVGNGALITGSNMIVLGNTSITALYCNVTSITALSDGRFKTNIKQNIHGLDFIMKLKPVSYTLEVRKLNEFRGKKENTNEKDGIDKAEQVVHNGFIAQDVEKAANEANYNFSGLTKPKNDSDTYGLGYSDFVVPLVKAVQELNDSLKQENNNLKAEIEKLKNQNKMQTAKIDNIQNTQTKNEEDIVALRKLIYTLTEKAEATKK
ncbi:MAG TPA: tail fiber domain-containing protein, partial [Bacteroidia bacterium]|nr:tail fiber domain-containing protein [Bacteroidia bacterium]